MKGEEKPLTKKQQREDRLPLFFQTAQNSDPSTSIFLKVRLISYSEITRWSSSCGNIKREATAAAPLRNRSNAAAHLNLEPLKIATDEGGGRKDGKKQMRD
eukprot:TRINITY_DN5998_c0_g4_i1.p1 TRINITY_DN5998_c0_g4~~TRINITY_DN5998_c0_g4_i1.p1  ORF type:complete len:101 (+),score=3.18 TRINITY_DN5998_c0_g4_i1:188-490(+)